jgi:hypothetical protein
MANTVIQIKRSTVTTAPTAGSLAAAEPAYSYLSDKLFIGSSDGTEVIEIGGRYYINTAVRAEATAIAAYTQANAAFAYANTISSDADEKANAAIITANLAFDAANAAFDFANTGGGALTIANLAFNKANSAYDYTSLVDANAIAAFGYANSVGTTASAAYDKANSANLLAYNTGIGANAYADAAAASANSYADATFLPLVGGTISGDLVVQGNTTFSGTTTYANTQTLLIGDNIMLLNADLPSSVAPSEDAGMEVNRGTLANVSLLWDEGSDKWTFTNDGTTYQNIIGDTDLSGVSTIASSAYGQANAAYTQANTAYDQANNAIDDATNALFVANLAFGKANTATDSATAANITANAAYGQANTATDSATAANITANSAYGKANDATDIAIAAFTRANNDVGTTNDGEVLFNDNGDIGGSSFFTYDKITHIVGLENLDVSGNSSLGTVTSGIWNGSTIAVPYGGTGMVSFTTNGVLYGNSSGALKVTASGTEGQVLQASSTGVPQFGMLDGGLF